MSPCSIIWESVCEAGFSYLSHAQRSHLFMFSFTPGHAFVAHGADTVFSVLGIKPRAFALTEPCVQPMSDTFIHAKIQRLRLCPSIQGASRLPEDDRSVN